MNYNWLYIIVSTYKYSYTTFCKYSVLKLIIKYN